MSGWSPLPDKYVTTTEVDDAEVSTMWLGLMAPPLTFETMILGGEHDRWCSVWRSEDEAWIGHASVVAWLRGEGDEPPS